jgi:CheY-like chemotaxis protein
MDGLATCRAFRSDPRLEPVPLIFLTAFDDAEQKAQAFRAGGRDCIPKPR